MKNIFILTTKTGQVIYYGTYDDCITVMDELKGYYDNEKIFMNEGENKREHN